ncbi:hypothetical protein FXO37_17464 [Capsicum annuum]|nr:hypothetical protein FXO37_17464 [Capsicum annuum]
MQVAPEAIKPRTRLPGCHASRRPPRIASQSWGALSSRGGYWPPVRHELAAGLNTSPRRWMSRQLVVVSQLSLSSRLRPITRSDSRTPSRSGAPTATPGQAGLPAEFKHINKRRKRNLQGFP